MNLESLYGKQYRVTLDPSFNLEQSEGKTAEKWRYWQIDGKKGQVYAYGWEQPAVTFKLLPSTRNLPGVEGWKCIQNGDYEATWLFPMAEIDRVIKAISPRKRRQLTPEQREAASERLKRYKFHRTTE